MLVNWNNCCPWLWLYKCTVKLHEHFCSNNFRIFIFRWTLVCQPSGRCCWTGRRACGGRTQTIWPKSRQGGGDQGSLWLTRSLVDFLRFWRNCYAIGLRWWWWLGTGRITRCAGRSSYCSWWCCWGKGDQMGSLKGSRELFNWSWGGEKFAFWPTWRTWGTK